jgi:hypothetical protein
MPDRFFDVELAARNFRYAFEATPADVITWDPGAWRGPRVLVPIAVDALVVETAAAAGSVWADVAIDPLDRDAARPAPFDTITGRPAGVHLHWALPDALTRGAQPDAPDDAPLAAGADPFAEQPETIDAGATEFPAVPDRWLVARIVAGATTTAVRTVAAWVVESALDPARRRATPLAQWREDRDDEPAPVLTAVGPGDPTFAVYYENTQNIVAFHDPLEGVARGPLTYLVCGWYSEIGRDPLHAAATERAWHAVLEQLRWALRDTTTERLDREAKRAQKAQSALGLESKAGETRPGLADAATQKSSGTMRSDVASSEKIRVGAGTARILDAAGSKASVLLLGRQRYFERSWPRQVLCHGAVFDVRWNARGGGFDVPAAGVPAPDAVSVAIGNSGAQALAALVAQRERTPGLERVMAAFHAGSLGDLSLEGGIARLEAALHADDFESSPGGFVLSDIEQGDMFPPASGSESRGRPAGTARESAAASGMGKITEVSRQAKRSFFRTEQDLAQVIESLAGRPRTGSAAAPAASPRRIETVRRAMPRWYQPRDPVVLFSEARRGYRHGEDGALDEQGRLTCRITGETVTQVSVNPWVGVDGATVRDAPLVDIRGSDLVTSDFRSGQIPAECGALLYETLLLDPTVVAVAREAIIRKAKAVRGGPSRQAQVVSSEGAGLRWSVEQSLPLAAYATAGIDVQALAAMSNVTGTVPHVLALRLWRRPWNPIDVSWELEWYPSPRGERDWELLETDFGLLEFDPADTARAERLPIGNEGAPALVVQGRTLLTPAVARTLERRLRRFLDDEKNGAADDASPTQEADLARAAAQFAALDVVAASLGGAHLALMARRPVPGTDTPDAGAWLPVDGADALWLMRAGHLRLRRARIIDTFGQFCDVAAAKLDAPLLAEDLRSRAGVPFLAMPPRLQEPARLMLRLLDAASDDQEATRDRSPVAGWIVPDHLDDALEVFNAAGGTQGQLQPAEGGRTLEWQGVPGQPDPLGAPPRIPQRHVAGFVDGLLRWGLRDPELAASGDPPSETALAALLRMIDATLWTTDPVGRAGNEHLSVIIGHPLALVRAELRLEVQGGDDPRALYGAARAELERTPFPVRLGELLALDDGLMGYFVNDDYHRFYPVHEALAPEARPSGPNRGFLGSAADTPDMAPLPVEHPYIDRTPVVYVRPGQRVMLTLLVDPRGSVHVTSGILPRKKIELMREHIAPALDAMALTFRVGPVLVDPDVIRMPLPAEIKGGWSWVRKVNVTTWQEDRVVKATQDALLPELPALISEGWLKVSGALRSSSEE